jgi:hypothetical protein
MELLIFAGLVWILPIHVLGEIGKPKNRRGYLWGFFLGWIGVIVVARVHGKQSACSGATRDLGRETGFFVRSACSFHVQQQRRLR